MHRYRVGGWCAVPWKGGTYHAEILSLDEDEAVVKVLDHSLPLGQWPELQVNLGEVQPALFKTAESQEELIESLKHTHALRDPFIEQAFREVDRSWFCQEIPYYDAAIDVGCGMCISSPHMHIWYLELAKDLFGRAEKILDVGTGTGYLAAIFARLAPMAEVYGVEYHAALTKKALATIQRHLPESEKNRIYLITAEGEKGYAEGAPYDIITVGFMCRAIPQPLVDQLKPGGRLILPVAVGRKSSYDERLSSGKFTVVEKRADGSVEIHRILSCSFLPSESKKSKAE